MNPPLQQSAILSESLTKKRKCAKGRLPAGGAVCRRLPEGVGSGGGGVGGEGDGAGGANHPALGFYEGGWGAGIRGLGDFSGEFGGRGCFFWGRYPVYCQSGAGEGIGGALGDADESR